MCMKTQFHAHTFKSQGSRRTLGWRKQRCVCVCLCLCLCLCVSWGGGSAGRQLWGDVGSGSSEDTHTHTRGQTCSRLPENITTLSRSLLLYHPLHLILSVSLSGLKGWFMSFSWSNHTGVTRRLIDMQWDNPTSATNITVCPASKQHHQPEHTNTLRWICQMTHGEKLWPYLTRQRTCMTSETERWDTFCMMGMSLTVTEIIWLVRTGQEVQQNVAPAKNRSVPW